MQLGNITLRRALLQACLKMTGDEGIQPSHLKQSGLGRTVMLLYRSKDETREMKEIHRKCVEQWSRPVFKNSANYRDLGNANDRAARKGTVHNSVVRAAANSPSKAQGAHKKERTGDDVAEVLKKGR